MNATVFAFVTLAGILALSACSTADAPGPLALTDKELARVVNRELSSDPRIPVNEIAVEADATTREVTLTGALMTEDDRALSSSPGALNRTW